MKVLGFVIIVVGFVLIWVGVTGDQHNLMATLKGSTTPAQSGLSINPSGSGGSSNTTTSQNNSPPGTVQAL